MYESISCYLIRKECRVIRDFYRYSRLHILLYLKTLARRERYNITIIFSLRALISSNIRSYTSFIKTKTFAKR